METPRTAYFLLLMLALLLFAPCAAGETDNTQNATEMGQLTDGTDGGEHISSLDVYCMYADHHTVDPRYTKTTSSNFVRYEIYKNGAAIGSCYNQNKGDYRVSGLSKNTSYTFFVRYYFQGDEGIYYFDSSVCSVVTDRVYGTPQEDTTWTRAMSPIMLGGNVNVESGVKLFIEEGVEVTVYDPTSRSEIYLNLEETHLRGVIFNEYDNYLITSVGSGSTLYGCTFKNRAVLYTDDVRDVLVDSSLFNSASLPTSWYGLGISNSQNLTITNNHFINTGLYLYNYTQSSLIENNQFNVSTNSTDFNSITVYGNNNRIRKNSVLNTSAESYIMVDGSNNIVSDNLFGKLYLRSNGNPCHSNTITRNKLLMGIQVGGGSHPVNNNTISSNYIETSTYYGGLNYEGNNATIVDNTLLKGAIITRGDGHRIKNNSVLNGRSWCAEIDYGNNILVENNRFFNSSLGVVLYDVDGFVVRDNEVANCSGTGIDIQSSSNGAVEHNTVRDGNVSPGSNGAVGIRLYKANYITIRNNNITNITDFGIYSATDSGPSIANEHITIDHNNISSNGHGTRYIYSSRRKSGIFLMETNNSTIINNRITDNRYNGLYIDTYTGNNTIYNNYFNNSGGNANVYYRTSAPNYRWNTTKTRGWNIAGGPYLGGNYWSDYAGYDNDSDLLGDVSYNKTEYYNPDVKILEDFHPLIPNPFDLELINMSAEPLIWGELCSINATVQTDAEIAVSDVRVVLYVNEEDADEKVITVPKNSSINVELEWDVVWNMEDARKPLTIEVRVDPHDKIYETNETNNDLLLEAPLERGSKFRGDNAGFTVSDVSLVPYVTPVAIWFEGAKPTYNPIATSLDVLIDIENDFAGTQFNAFYTLDDSIKTMGSTSFWEESPGVVMTVDTDVCTVQAAPVASYLNWPMVSSDITDAQLMSLINLLDAQYIVLITDCEANTTSLVERLELLELEDFQLLLVYYVEVGSVETPTDLFDDVLDSFGDRSGAIVVANTREDSSLASAPVLAYYKGMLVDARDAVDTQIIYPDVSYATLITVNGNINDRVKNIVDGAGDSDIVDALGYSMVPNPLLFIVGTEGYVPFWIEKEEAGLKATDSDRDWTAGDYPYYHASARIAAGGRVPLSAADNLNHAAMALQFAELPMGHRGSWEDDFLISGIYNTDGERRWAKNWAWWLEPALKTSKFLKVKGGNLTQLYEKPSAHKGEKSKAWYAFDRSRNRWVIEAPLNYESNASVLPAGQSWGVNDDHDCVAQETGTTFAELWVDADNDSIIDAGEFVYQGNVAGKNNNGWFERIDEEILDGVDNDGDGLIDEDVGHFYYREVDEVYNEHWAEGAASPSEPDVDSYEDLIVPNLQTYIKDKGIVIYNGHGYAQGWAMRNLRGWSRAKDPAGNFYQDNRTNNDVLFNNGSVPKMIPSTVFACACHTGRVWEAGSIAKAFLTSGTLSYIGSTAIAYAGPSDQMLHSFIAKLARGDTVGDAYKRSIDELTKDSLWSKRFKTSSALTNKSKHEFVLFGLSAVKVDPAEGEQRVSYGEPVYNQSSGLWHIDIAMDFPEPVETEINGTVSEIQFPELTNQVFSAGYPALPLLHFEHSTPTCANITDVVLANATLYATYNLSQPVITPVSLWADPLNITMPSLEEGGLGPSNESIPGVQTIVGVDENSTPSPPEMYVGELFPDVLFVAETEHDNHTNTDRVTGSASVWQVNGSANQTYVYDNITLRVFYTAPLSIDETHTFEEGRLVVDTRLASTDNSTHNVSTQLKIRASDGILIGVVNGSNATITGSPCLVSFDTEVEQRSFTGRVCVFENDQLIAEKSFTQRASLFACAHTNHSVNNVRSPSYFNASASHPEEYISSYAWDFGDNESGVGEVVSHRYSSYNWSGEAYVPFTVCLDVVDDAGTVNSTCLSVLVFMAGDANGDGVANIQDAASVGLHWNARYGGAEYHDGADLNNDDVVNILDAALVGLHWNERA